MARLQLALDIGGTFTDVLMVDGESGAPWTTDGVGPVYYVAQNNDPTEFAAMGFGVRVEGYEELPQAAE